jgi:hypothetical protein
MVYLLTAIGLAPGGSSTVHIYTQTIHRTTQNKQYIEQHKNFGREYPKSLLTEMLTCQRKFMHIKPPAESHTEELQKLLEFSFFLLNSNFTSPKLSLINSLHLSYERNLFKTTFRTAGIACRGHIRGAHVIHSACKW